MSYIHILITNSITQLLLIQQLVFQPVTGESNEDVYNATFIGSGGATGVTYKRGDVNITVKQTFGTQSTEFLFSIIEWRVSMDNLGLLSFGSSECHLAGGIYLRLREKIIVRCFYDERKFEVVGTPMRIRVNPGIVKFLLAQNRVLCSKFDDIDKQEPCFNLHHNQLAFWLCDICQPLAPPQYSN